jgi:hypothetical protein
MDEAEEFRKKITDKFGNTMEILMEYKPKSVEQLAEWLIIAARLTMDQEGKRIYFRLDHSIAYQMAKMMQAAELKMPEKK